MDTTLLKSFATSSRTELIREVAARITAVLAQGSPERVEQPRAVSELERAISVGGGGDKGKAHVADKVAYTWFNRIIALRFMDANGYTGIGVVSPAADQVGQPEILAAAKRGQVDGDVVKGANVATIRGLLNGTRQPRPGVDAQAEAYSLLLADYCRYWNRAMPFMFEREGDFTELLIPANVLAEDSVLSRSVNVLTEEVCQDVEVIGWLYQFYISERKDEVFAGFKKNKKAGADEIPAATQLFTPHWIVRYLVENSVGRLWMLNHPESRLVDQMEYYIAPVDEETDFLKISKPEELTVIDPACGSGHMLTYAFDLLYAIYEEEGYTPSQIPGLILTNNLYGTEIDPRAGALAAFALTMKATAKRKLFLKNPVAPNICVLEPISFSDEELSYLVPKDGDHHAEEGFWNQFAEADTFGSLIQPDRVLTIQLAKQITALDAEGDLFVADVIGRARRVVNQAEYLVREHAVTIANPPYMGSANMSPVLNEWMRLKYPSSKADLFGGFIERGISLTRHGGHCALVTMQSWMFLGGFEKLRKQLHTGAPIVSMAHLGAGAFDSIAGEVVATTAFILAPGRRARTAGFVRLVSTSGAAAKAARLRDVSAGREHTIKANFDSFAKIPGSPIAYWVSEAQAALYESGQLLSAVGAARKGIDTGENARFVRFWFEVPSGQLRLDPAHTWAKWVPYNKGGPNLRWYGNRYWVVNWHNDGAEIKSMTRAVTKRATIRNPDYFFREGFTYTTVSPGKFSARYTPGNAVFDSGGGTYFADSNLMTYGALLNSEVAARYFEFLAPTLNYQPGDVSRVPVAPGLEDLSLEGSAAVEAARQIWDSSELSWDFQGLGVRSMLVEHWAGERCSSLTDLRQTIAQIESRNDRKIAELYGLPLDRTVPDDRTVIPDDEGTVSDLVSYAVGCMFGRYSLDAPGLILADQGATLQDYLVKVPSPVFTPDSDNVIPLVDGDWFEDDIVERFRQFLRAAFGEQHFEENLQFVTKSLGVKHLRDYFVKSFYKDHVKRYKKRPIYWLFSSPKGSFNALIYMHRYTPSTVSTVLTYLREYVTKLESALQQAERAGNAKEADRLRKILVELNEYEHDTLFPKASENIVIDLDDGVKVNYPRFGVALKKVPGLEAASD